MALVLGIKPGASFFVGETEVVMEKVFSPTHFKVKVITPTMEHVYTITDKRSEEILPNVWVSAGKGGTEKMVKVAIRAPRNVTILREKLYANGDSESQ